LTLAPESSLPYTINIIPFGNATGQVRFTVSGLPQGVTAAFSANPANEGTSTVLTLTAAPGTALTGAHPVDVTVTATPLTASAGSIPHSLDLSLAIQPNFSLSVPDVPTDHGVPQVGLPPCTAVPVTVEVDRQVGFTDPVTLGLGSLPAGVTASFSQN